jgi:hypothetical protein
MRNPDSLAAVAQDEETGNRENADSVAGDTYSRPQEATFLSTSQTYRIAHAVRDGERMSQPPWLIAIRGSSLAFVKGRGRIPMLVATDNPLRSDTVRP